jgi:hypothetical protein
METSMFLPNLAPLCYLIAVVCGSCLVVYGAATFYYRFKQQRFWDNAGKLAAEPLSDEESAALELWSLPPGSTVELADFQEPVQGNYPQEQTVNVNYSTDPESIKKVKALFDKAAEAALAWENSKDRRIHPVTNSAKIPLPSADELTTISQQQAEAALSFRAEYVEAYEDDVHSLPTPFMRPR